MKHLDFPRKALPASMRSRFTRRKFLADGLVTVGGAVVLPTVIPASAIGAEDAVAPSNRVTVGLIGKGAMGSGHLHRLANDPAFHLLAVCDPDRQRREAGRKVVDDVYSARRSGGSPFQGCHACVDYRDVLARSDIDAVLIATPDHWHTLLSIHAAKAGKDVYCEKPVSVTLREGRELVQVVQRYHRVFQTGTQYRSIAAIRKTCEFIRRGGLGRIKAVFTPYAPLRSFLGGERVKPYAGVLNLDQCGGSFVPLDFALPEEPVPEGLDWEMWVGPAPWRPYNRLYHINPSPGVVPWSFADAFGVTSSTWFLSHAADVIQYALGFERSGPVEILHPSGGAFPTLTCRYADGTLLHMVEHWGVVKEVYKAVPSGARLAGNFGGLFVGERGWLTNMSASGPLEASPESLFEEMGIVRTPEVNIGGNNHHANWLSCIHTRQAPSAEEEIGHRAASLGHLVNIASLLGRSLEWDPVQETFPKDEQANRLLSRALRAPWRI